MITSLSLITIICFLYMYITVSSVNINLRPLLLINLGFLFGVEVIKDILYNIVLFKKKTIAAARWVFRDKEGLDGFNYFVFVVSGALIFTGIVLLIIDKHFYLYSDVLVIGGIALIFTVYRFVYNAVEFYFTHVVVELSVKLTDESVFENISSYEQVDNVIRITQKDKNIIFYFESDKVLTIEKTISKKCTVDIVLEKVAEKKKVKCN